MMLSYILSIILWHTLHYRRRRIEYLIESFLKLRHAYSQEFVFNNRSSKCMWIISMFLVAHSLPITIYLAIKEPKGNHEIGFLTILLINRLFILTLMWLLPTILTLFCSIMFLDIRKSLVRCKILLKKTPLKSLNKSLEMYRKTLLIKHKMERVLSLPIIIMISQEFLEIYWGLNELIGDANTKSLVSRTFLSLSLLLCNSFLYLCVSTTACEMDEEYKSLRRTFVLSQNSVHCTDVSNGESKCNILVDNSCRMSFSVCGIITFTRELILSSIGVTATYVLLIIQN